MSGNLTHSALNKLIVAAALLAVLSIVYIFMQRGRIGVSPHEDKNAPIEQPVDSFLNKNNTVSATPQTPQSNGQFKSSPNKPLSVLSQSPIETRTEQNNSQIQSTYQPWTVDSYRNWLLQHIESGQPIYSGPLQSLPEEAAHLRPILLPTASEALAMFDANSPERQEEYIALLNNPSPIFEALEASARDNAPPLSVTEVNRTDNITGEVTTTRIEEYGLFRNITVGKPTVRPATDEERELYEMRKAQSKY